MKIQNSVFIFMLAFVLSALAGVDILAADGDIDTSFGTNGIVTEGAPFTGFDTVVVQPDGKILGAGFAVISTPASFFKFSVVRYNPNGSLDTSFGTGGRLFVEVAGRNLTLPVLLLQPDGKIVIVGRAQPTGSGSQTSILLRFNANGSTDTAFGTNGVVLSTFAGIPADAVLQPDGKIVFTAALDGSPYCVVRHNTDGSLDTTFGTGGKVCAAVLPAGTGLPSSIALQTDGKIVVSGSFTTSFNVPFDFIVFRFNPNGSLDTSFDGDGYARTDLNGNDNALSVIVRPNGKILAVGSARAVNAPDTGFGLVQYNANGSLDASFGTGGKAITTFAGGEGFAEDFPAALQTNGTVVIGRSRMRESPNFGNESQIARFNENGSLDATFGSGGQIIFLPIQNVRDLVLQPDGKIVAVGVNQPGNSITARFLNGNSAPPVNNPAQRIADFDGDMRSDTSVFRTGTWLINPSSNPSSLSDSPEGFYGVPFGLATDRLTPADFDGDGKTDIAVWRENTGNPDKAVFYVLNSLNGTFRTEQFGRIGDDPMIVGDWDGDGKADPAVYRAGAGGVQSQFYYRPSSQAGVDFTTVYWGSAGDRPIRGDFDGDARPDAAVFRPSDGVWYIRQSTTGTPRYERWGVASDNFVPADYDADGKTDLAVFRNGTWYILQSTSGQPIFRNWGLSTDALVPGDYDGDGRADIATWRNGVFYILQSTNSSPVYRNFGAIGDVPVASAFIR